MSSSGPVQVEMSGPSLCRSRPQSLCFLTAPPPEKRSKLSVPPQSSHTSGGGGGLKLQGCCFSPPASATLSPVRQLAVPELAARLTANSLQCPPLLLLDCRSFLSYNVKHIQGSLNVNCSDRIHKKRLLQGKIHVSELVVPREPSYRKRLQCREVVLYDDSSTDANLLNTGQPLYLVIKALQREGRDPSLLKGGLSAFQTEHPTLCEDCLKPPCPQLTPDEELLQPVIHSSPTSAPPICPVADVERAPVSEVLPNFLYLGNERDAAQLPLLRKLGITHVLNVTANVPFHHQRGNILYKRLPATDCVQQNLRQYFDEAYEFIESARTSENGRVFVHCHAGVSRSATITVAYIMQRDKLSMLEAYRIVKNMRCIISPNLNFMGQLVEFEKELEPNPGLKTSASCCLGFSGATVNTMDEKKEVVESGSSELMALDHVQHRPKAKTNRPRPNSICFVTTNHQATTTDSSNNNNTFKTTNNNKIWPPILNQPNTRNSATNRQYMYETSV